MKNNYFLAATFVSAIFANTIFIAPHSIASQTIKSKSYPTDGKVVNLTNGDLMCYVELIDTRGKQHMLGADFDICQQTKLLNKQVKLTYKRGKVNDCQSAEPCGKSRIENLIFRMRSTSKK
jgi:hypothetical protein